ncbi:MAG TPA: heavy metal-associated domain-containing protein [Pantanalinema sp.]
MKKGFLVLAALALTLTAGNAIACGEGSSCAPGTCAVDKKAGATAPKAAAPAKAVKKDACQLSTRLEVLGMECASCADHVTKSLQGVKGVEAVSVNLESGIASVDYCSMELKDTSALIKAVEKAGYDAKLAAASPKAAPAKAAPAKPQP